MTDHDRAQDAEEMSIVNKLDGDVAVAPQMNSEPGNPERDKRAMYRPSHRATDSATANPDQSTPALAESAK